LQSPPLLKRLGEINTLCPLGHSISILVFEFIYSSPITFQFRSEASSITSSNVPLLLSALSFLAHSKHQESIFSMLLNRDSKICPSLQDQRYFFVVTV